MKIRQTEIFRFSIPMEPFTIATGTMAFAQNVFIRVHTDVGITGVGECSAFPMIVGETQDTCLVLAKDFAAIWKGKDPLNIHGTMKELEDYCAHNHTIKSAFDMALYDIAAKAAGLPLYQFLRGKKKTVETDITIGIGEPERMQDAAVKFKAEGASILKIKLGKKPEEDIDRVRKIRSAVGSGMTLRLDANQGWSYDDAVKAFDAMRDLDIQFCEQPMRSYDDEKLPALVQRSGVKIMADESCYNHYDAERLIKAKACDFINIKLAKTGGIKEAMKIQEFAGAAGIHCMMGGMLESRLALTANLHLVYASPGIHFYDMDTCMIGHLTDPIQGGVRYNGFFLELDDAPGIGAEVDETFLSSCERFVVLILFFPETIRMAANKNKILIKNMVCQRCIMTVEKIFADLQIPATSVSMGEVEVERKLTNQECKALEEALKKVGFQLIESRVNKIIDDIKKAVIEYLALGIDGQNIKLSTLITRKLPYEYSYLSDLFSSIEGKTIESYFISQRIEKVKELLVYDQLSLTEISYETGFSSVHHLSSQFKKVTGLTPSHFKKIGAEKRKSLDQL